MTQIILVDEELTVARLVFIVHKSSPAPYIRIVDNWIEVSCEMIHIFSGQICFHVVENSVSIFVKMPFWIDQHVFVVLAFDGSKIFGQFKNHVIHVGFVFQSHTESDTRYGGEIQTYFTRIAVIGWNQRTSEK